MNDQIEKGQLVKGVVTGIQPYGAFVSLGENRQGLIHISEITHGYVRDIKEYLSVGSEVTVKVLDVNEAEGKISLSLKALEKVKPELKLREEKTFHNIQELTNSSKQGFNTLKEKLAEWIEQSKNEHLIQK